MDVLAWAGTAADHDAPCVVELQECIDELINGTDALPHDGTDPITLPHTHPHTDLRLTFYTRSELVELVNETWSRRLDLLGIQSNTRCAIVHDHRLAIDVQLVAAVLALWKRGSCVCPVRKEREAQRVGAAYVLFGSDGGELQLKCAREQMDPEENTDVSVDASMSIAYLIRTSGTSSAGAGTSVRVPFTTVRQHIADCAMALQVLAFPATTLTSSARRPDCAIAHRTALLSPLTFDPWIVELLLPLSLPHGSMVLLGRHHHRIVRSPRLLYRALVAAKVNTLLMTPSLFMTFDNDTRQCILRGETHVRRVILGGEPFPRQLLDSEPVVELYNIYGTTECSVWATLARMHVGHSTVYIGVPIGAGTRVEVRTDDGRIVNVFEKDVQVDVEGELWIGGPTRQCLVDDEMCAKIMRPTGDRARCIGGKLQLTGRIVDMVKRRGHRVHPDGVAADLSQELCSSVATVVVVTADYETMSAVCFNDPAGISTRLQRMRKAILAVPYYMRPDVYYLLPREVELPLTTHGKTDRRKILAMLDMWRLYRYELVDVLQVGKHDENNADSGHERISIDDAFNDKKTSTTTRWLLALYSSILGGPKVLENISLLSAGGTSMDAFRIVESILRRYSLGEARKVADTDVDSLCQRLMTCVLHGTIGDLSIAIDQLRFFDTQGHLQSDVSCPPVKRQRTNISPTTNYASSASASGAIRVVATNTGAPKLNFAWRLHMERCVDASPLVLLTNTGDGLFVIAASHAGLVAAVQADTGHVVWEYNLHTRTETAPVMMVDEQVVVLVGYDGSVHCVESANGLRRALWRCPRELNVVGDGEDKTVMIKSRPAVHGKTIHVATYDGHYHELVLDGSSLQSRLTLAIHGSVYAAVVHFDIANTVLVATTSGWIYARQCETSSKDWSWRLRLCETPIFATPVVSNCGSFAWIAGVDGVVRSVDVRSGVVLHSLAIPGTCQDAQSPPIPLPSIFGAPCLFSDGTFDSLLFGTNRGQLCLLNISDPSRPTLHWTHEMPRTSTNTPSNLFASPFLINAEDGRQWAVVATASGQIHLVDLKKSASSIISSLQLPADVFSSPVVVAMESRLLSSATSLRLFIGCRDDHLYALDVEWKSLKQSQ